MNNKLIYLGLLVSSILFLNNCELFKKQENDTVSKDVGAVQPPATGVMTENVLLSIGGKPVITVSDFEEYVNSVMSAQPQLGQLRSFMPDLDKELFGNMVKEVVIQEWIAQKGIDKTPEYQKDKKTSAQFLERQLALKYFQEKYPKLKNIVITDDQVRKAYEEQKKTIPQLTISRGGVNAVGVMLDKQSDAQEFLNKVKEPGAVFENVAKDKGLTVKNFTTVNEYSFDIDSQIKEKIVTLTRFPSYDLIKSKDDKYWVVKTTGKEESKYVPLEEVKDAFKQQLLMQRLFGPELDELQKQMNVVENKAYFEKLSKERQNELDKMQKQEEAMQKRVQPQPRAKKNDTPQRASMPQAPVKGT